MNTHELAKALREFAQLLEKFPNQSTSRFQQSLFPDLEERNGSLAVNLATLASLSRIDKRQWQALVSDYGFPIEIRPRDASRDVLGKLLNYLETNDEALRKLRTRVSAPNAGVSSELQLALEALLKQQ